jgi:hypothetical protein
MATGARTCTAKDANPPMTIIPIGVVIGQISKRLADSVHNWLNSMRAQSHSENTLAHRLLN